MNKRVDDRTGSANPRKKLVKAILISLAAPFGLILVGALILAIYFFIADPILDKIDNVKFTSLDDKMQAIYNQIKSDIESDETVTYNAECKPELKGDWPTGKYNCENTVRLTKNITSAAELKALHEKYFSVIDDNDNFKSSGSLDVMSPSTFGLQFVVSGVEGHYVDKKTNLACTYLAELQQTDENYSFNDDNYLYGTELVNGVGEARVSVRCWNLARDAWYRYTN